MARRLTATLLVLTLAAAAGAASTVPAHASPGGEVLVEVKFDEALAVRGAGDELRSQRGHSLARVEAVLERSGALEVRPFVPAEAAERLARLAAEAGVPDLTAWYTVVLPAGTAADRITGQLRALPEVAYADPVPAQAPPPPPQATPDFTGLQGYFRPAAQNGIDADFTRQDPRLRGSGITIVDLEYTWNPFHEDLQLDWSIDVGDGVFRPWSHYLDDHGTAVLGQLVAVENSFGVSGGVPEADVYGISPMDDVVFEANWLPGPALAHLAARGDGQGGSFLQPGDVVLLEQQGSRVIPASDCPVTPPTDDCYAPLEWLVAVHDAIQVLTGMGVNVVATGGNGYHSTDHPAYTRDGLPWFRPSNHSGSIMVGAGNSGSRERLAFSNHGPRFDLQGWGNSIVTTGYCTLFCPSHNRSYANNFGGTSGAGPIVTVAVVAIQSYLRATGQPAWSAQQVTDLLESTGQPQGPGTSGQHIGPLPNLRAALAAIEVDPPVVTASRDSQLVTLSADDGWGSGVERILYRLDGAGQWVTYDGPFRISGAGERTIEYRAVDANGNAGPVESASFVNLVPRSVP